jgi:tRNA threonylcarbamoyladenosine modification (KEOPS) complex  Pcc1 subunit
MISCTLEINEDIDDLYQLFLPENLKSDRAECTIKKGKTLKFTITAKDPVSMKAFTNSVLNIIHTYQKIKNETSNQGKNHSASKS